MITKQNKTVTHTPLPWDMDRTDWPILINGPDDLEEDSNVVAIVECRGMNGQHTYSYPPDVALANTEFILQAVNCHDDLVKSLEKVLAVIEPDTEFFDPPVQEDIQAARYVLATAKDVRR